MLELNYIIAIITIILGVIAFLWLGGGVIFLILGRFIKFPTNKFTENLSLGGLFGIVIFVLGFSFWIAEEASDEFVGILILIVLISFFIIYRLYRSFEEKSSRVEQLEEKLYKKNYMVKELKKKLKRAKGNFEIK